MSVLLLLQPQQTRGKNVSTPRILLPGESPGKSVDGWVGPAGLRGLTVCDSLEQMVVVGCVHTQTHMQRSASNFSAGRR